MRRVVSVLLAGLAGLVTATPADAATRHLKVVWTGSGHATIAQYRDSRLPDTKVGWDVYSKRVRWRITIPLTISGGYVEKAGRPRGSVSGTGTVLGRSGGVTSCSGPVELPTISGMPTVPVQLGARGSSHNVIKLRISSIYTTVGALPLIWAFVPACGTSISNATSVLVRPGQATSFATGVATTDFSVLPADNFRAQPTSFGARLDAPPIDFQRSIDYAFNARVRVEQG